MGKCSDTEELVLPQRRLLTKFIEVNSSDVPLKCIEMWFSCLPNVITDCTVVQHCCKGDKPFQWVMENFKPSYVPNPSPLNLPTIVDCHVLLQSMLCLEQ